MIPLAAGELEGVRLASGDAARVITAAVVDSRLVVPGALFVALRGERTDGHEHIRQAVERGAAAVLCEDGRAPDLGAVAALEAADPLAALGVVARQVRRRSAAKVVGIAGSAGKTSTKDVLAGLCAAATATVASHANFNNELGVPLTLTRIDPETRVCVAELAMRGLGQVAYLASLAEPDVAVITAIGPEHLELLGSVEQVARAEAEVLEALPPGGAAVLPQDEPLLEPYRRSDVRELRFGLAPGADVYPLRWQPGPDGTEAEFSVAGERLALRTPLRAPHHRLNLAAALAAHVALGLPLEAAAAGAERVELSRWRGEERPLAGGGVLINDAYNANPISMPAALAALAERAGEARAVAVLGEMAELGDEAERWHRQVGEAVAAAGVDLLIAVGPKARAYCDGAPEVESIWVATREEAAERLAGALRPGDVVLVKASRSAGLERLAEAMA